MRRASIEFDTAPYNAVRLMVRKIRYLLSCKHNSEIW